MDNVRCHYVYDEEEKIVHVDDVSRDTAKSHRYHCISCGAEMIPKLGNLREHHFAHKAACSCNSETYLHKLGKILLKKKWDESPEFYIRYMQRVKCGKYKDCVFYKDNVCEDSMLSEKYDLEEFYDTCDVERSVGEFKPDLYLYHSGFSNRRGVFIEIKVTHESTDKKKNSENKILEIHVQSDVELRELLKGEIIENKEIRFMGFKQECRKEILLSKRMLFRFFLYSNGGAYVSNYEDMLRCDVGKLKSKAILELNMDSDKCSYLGEVNLYEVGLMYAVHEGFKIKNCHLCKYHRVGEDSPIFCCMSKKYGTPREPKQTEASSCRYYTVDKEFFDKKEEYFAKVQISEVK